MVDDLTPAAILARNYPPKDFDHTVLARVLGEDRPGQHMRLVQIHTYFGSFATWRLLQKTLDVEAHGGTVVEEDGRRRTPGGTFFWLAQQWQAACPPQHPTQAPARPQTPTITHTLAALPDAWEHGACTMKMTLVGRPGPIQDCQTYVAFAMDGAPPATLPKGLPAPPEPPLSWVVMVGKKQWTKAAASLATMTTPKVIVEGYPCVQGSTHVLLAMQCTTTALQQAKALAQAGAGATPVSD